MDQISCRYHVTKYDAHDKFIESTGFSHHWSTKLGPWNSWEMMIVPGLVMTNSLLLKMAIYSEFTHLSIVMLIYWRVTQQTR